MPVLPTATITAITPRIDIFIISITSIIIDFRSAGLKTSPLGPKQPFLGQNAAACGMLNGGKESGKPPGVAGARWRSLFPHSVPGHAPTPSASFWGPGPRPLLPPSLCCDNRSMAVAQPSPTETARRGGRGPQQGPRRRAPRPPFKRPRPPLGAPQPRSPASAHPPRPRYLARRRGSQSRRRIAGAGSPTAMTCRRLGLAYRPVDGLASIFKP